MRPKTKEPRLRKQIRFTTQEWDFLRDQAITNCCSISSYIRSECLRDFTRPETCADAPNTQQDDLNNKEE